MKSNRGFTLVEVLIAAGVVGLMSIGILTIIISFAQNNSRAAAREDLADLNKVLQLLMMNDNLCNRALVSAGGGPVAFVPPQVDLGSVVNPNTLGTVNPVVRSGEVYGRLQIGQMTLVKSDGTDPPRQESLLLNDPGTLPPTGNPPAPVQRTYTIYKANLVVPTSSRTDSPTGPRQSFAPLVIPLFLYTISGSPDVVRCQLASATNQTCTSLGGTYDPIQARCVFPACNQTVIDAQVARGIPDYTCQTGSNCSPPVYYWGFQAQQGRPTLPICICANSCAPPSPY